ncbi:MAG: hypothetical protein JXX28_02975 [Deltaproteobacteria bacterium]|nr:hypothetical protein [Deltaproteobacteria bacterium]
MRAAIDIGSNSILLTVVNPEGEVVHDEARVVGLSLGLGERGMFAPDRMKAAESVLTEYLDTARRFGLEPWQVVAVSTSGARRAMNASTWFSRIQRQQGLKIQVISGEEEANLTWLGAWQGLSLPPGPVLVVDLGGGSTELVVGEAGQVHDRTSLEMGAVRLTERFLGLGTTDLGALSRMREEIEHHLEISGLRPGVRTVVGVGGTATTLTAMRLGLRRWDPTQVHGARLSRTDLSRFVDDLISASPAARRAMAPTDPERADFLLAGAAILERVLMRAGRSSMFISNRGLRFGLLTPAG